MRQIIYEKGWGKFLLSQAAQLYEAYVFLSDGKTCEVTAGQICTALDWSKATYRRYRSLLEFKGLIHVELLDNEVGGNGKTKIFINQKHIKMGNQKLREGQSSLKGGGIRNLPPKTGACNDCEFIGYQVVSALTSNGNVGVSKIKPPIYSINNIIYNIGKKQKSLISGLSIPDSIIEEFITFLEYRQQLGKPLKTKYAINLHLNAMRKEPDLKAKLERAMSKEWIDWRYDLPDKSDKKATEPNNRMKNNADLIKKGLI